MNDNISYIKHCKETDVSILEKKENENKVIAQRVLVKGQYTHRILI